MELGEFISLRRKQNGLTIDELSAKSNIPKGTINKIIAGITKDPQLETVRAIAHALGCSLDDLYDDSDSSTLLKTSEYPVMAKYRRLTSEEQNRVDALIDRVLAGQPLTDPATQKKPAPTNEGELSEAIIDMILQLQLTPYELQRLIDFAKGIAAARTAPPTDQHQGR